MSDEPKWPRWSVTSHITGGHTSDRRTIVASLLFDGEVKHELRGPTAVASLEAEAGRLNRKRYVPPPPAPKTVADGLPRWFGACKKKPYKWP